MTMTMKRRQQASPVNERRPILPEVVQDEYDKKTKSQQWSFDAMKRALSQSLSRPLVLAACSLFSLVLVLGSFQFMKRSPHNEKRPITLHLHRDSLYYGVIPLKLTNHPFHLIQHRKNQGWVNHGTKWHHFEFEQDDDDDKCIPLGDWQDERNIFACNPFHEVNLMDPTLLNVGAGSYRDAWAFQEYDGTRQVIKTLVWDNHLDWDEFAAARKEAMAMAQLTFSPYVANIYGACSHSTIMDYSPDGILWWLFDDFEPTRNELLQIANDVAMGVADAQNVSIGFLEIGVRW